MLNSLIAKYKSDLSQSLRSAVVEDIPEDKEQRALVYGNGSPVYLTHVHIDVMAYPPQDKVQDVINDLVVFQVSPPKYISTGDFDVTEADDHLVVTSEHLAEALVLEEHVNHTLEINGESVNIIYNKDKLHCLIDLLEILTDCLECNAFYGMTAAIDDTILHISHPMVLKSLISTIEDPEELIFDNVWIYNFKTQLEVEEDDFININEIFEEIKQAVDHSNKHSYNLTTSMRENTVHIKETYDNSTDFTCILPVQVAYFSHVSYPYYGIEQVLIGCGDPQGTNLWPVISPNIDVGESWDVCTGAHLKILEGVSMTFNANFASSYRPAKELGTLRSGWKSAVFVLQLETKRILNKEFGTEFDVELPSRIRLLEKRFDGVLNHTSVSILTELEQEISPSDICIPTGLLKNFKVSADEYLSRLSGTYDEILACNKFIDKIIEARN